MNKVILTGRCATIPESKATSTGKDMCTFKLAVNKWGKDEAMFVPVKTFGKTAEVCQKYLVKGQETAISGRLNVETYDRNGQKMTWTEVLADEVELGSKPKNAEKNQKEEKALTDLFGNNFLKDDEPLPF